MVSLKFHNPIRCKNFQNSGNYRRSSNLHTSNISGVQESIEFPRKIHLMSFDSRLKIEHLDFLIRLKIRKVLAIISLESRNNGEYKDFFFKERDGNLIEWKEWSEKMVRWNIQI